MKTERLKLPIRREVPGIRKSEIIEAALRLASDIGVHALMRDKVAQEAGISSGLLYRYFGQMESLREIVIQTAFDREDTNILYKSLAIEDFKRLNRNPRLTKELCDFLMR